MIQTFLFVRLGEGR